MFEVRISVYSATDFSISYENRFPNTHRFRAATPEIAIEWITTLELATQREADRFVQGNQDKSMSLLKASFNVNTPRSRGPTFASPVPMGSGSFSSDMIREFLPLYPTREDLIAQGLGGYSKYLQAEEIVAEDLGTMRLGWSLIAGRLSDLVLWCVATSDRTNHGRPFFCLSTQPLSND